MSLEAAIAANTAALHELISRLPALAPAAQEAPSKKPAASSASGPNTVEVAAAPAKTASESTPAAASVETESPASTAATEVSYDTISKAITDGVKADRAHVVATLAAFNVKKGSELKTADYADFLAALTERVTA